MQSSRSSNSFRRSIVRSYRSVSPPNKSRSNRNLSLIPIACFRSVIRSLRTISEAMSFGAAIVSASVCTSPPNTSPSTGSGSAANGYFGASVLAEVVSATTVFCEAATEASASAALSACSEISGSVFACTRSVTYC